ncbi:bifunctional UDP-N-acetylglucosamine diphosphorylase/glucosamine-1-phosphate N-acetyltransferase GlmU [Nocardioides marmoribigeumensis]|uniref:Bifunctional protein GlmU n=1 Tax=Nocardioides marmoribigeumensis TaxID=433649 RepID=A0ABU2BZG2_9ACTN|nr:bifunctional UDP-N-acetylglucosamine diphosphorylase/glucosamine-1-phosphate N-acetyltransferase GlmU [Nocardioides marmoribigeumensis]MDR7363795.1 bifunctional UDP-N-acetylglucosamine pyrophosphorylase/glucosamine-1-phosphate N-acetyltransferase [Nocardioides marmoribigeumensis]
MARPAAVIVLAAGSGTRMKSKTMKVLHPICGRSMVGHVLTAAVAVDARRVVAVVGHGREQVGPHVQEHVPGAVLAVQETQEGTGHAVRMGVEALLAADAEGTDGTVVVMTGDTPLLEGATLVDLVADHDAAGRAVTILTGELDDPFGYGRVVRDEAGEVLAVVEEKDATDEQRAVREINSGIYAFDGRFLADALGRITNDNAKGEYYLTDVVAIARADGASVGAHVTDDVMQTEGANDRAQLAALGAHLNRRTLDHWMREGVTVVDPSTTWIDVTVTLERDTTVLPGVQLLGATTVAEDAVVGPDSTLKDCEVGPGAKVVRTHGELAVIGAGANVGPFSYLRPGTVLGEGGKIGAFVETKNARIGDGAKVPHLSYVGDAEIGEQTNIGAGTIFANYDGVAKHRTTVGRHARTGSNNTFVAPVTIGDGAVTGGGTVVRRDVPAGALAVNDVQQRVVEGWVQERRPGTPAAEAAGAAGAAVAGADTGRDQTDTSQGATRDDGSPTPG